MMTRLQVVLVESGIFRKGRIASNVAVLIGLLSLAYYYSWWFRDGRLSSPWLFLAFIFALVYGIFQLVGNWTLYLWANRRPRRGQLPIPSALTIDVFVTAHDEETDLVEHCLAAACKMHVEHRTWLLDDADRPELEVLAARLGAGYLTRNGNSDFKAGNINAALSRTHGDIIVIFDIDHVPDKRFLERTVGYFSEPRMGFVQVMLTFSSAGKAWVARAASDSSLDFYNPASVGADGLGSTTLMGSNALIRRAALESIGGYQPGLAEDLATSISLHAAHWKSIYINKPLAPGLAPPDLTAWFNQQFKWARGVFELFITKYWRMFRELTPGQRLVYGVRMTYYWIPIVFFIHLLVTVAVLLSRSKTVLVEYENYLLYLLPLAAATALIRLVVLRHHAYPKLKEDMNKGATSQWKPLFLVIGTWPVYLVAWFLAVLRIPTSFLPTPKKATGHGPSFAWIWPQILAIVALFAGMIVTQRSLGIHNYLIVLAFAIALTAGQLGVLVQAWRETVTNKRKNRRIV